MVTLEQVYELAEQLKFEDKVQPIARLRQKINQSTGSVTREQLLAEIERKKAADVFENAESLYGKFANPEVDFSDEELRACLHEVGREWEAEMDELDPDDAY